MNVRSLASALLLVAATLPTTDAAQVPTPVPDSGGARPTRHPCFQQYLDDLEACCDAFCNVDGCNEPLLEACIEGAVHAALVCFYG